MKDCNFYGIRDEYVVSGSDDGNIFIWRKADGKLVQILHGDDDVANVIEGHPFYPMMAVSGIDHTVKIFSPFTEEAKDRIGSMMNDKEMIVVQNEEARRHQSDGAIGIPRAMLNALLRHMARRNGVEGGDSDGDSEEDANCPVQ